MYTWLARSMYNAHTVDQKHVHTVGQKSIHPLYMTVHMYDCMYK